MASKKKRSAQAKREPIPSQKYPQKEQPQIPPQLDQDVPTKRINWLSEIFKVSQTVSLVFITLASLAVSQLSLSPVYGSIPSSPPRFRATTAVFCLAGMMQLLRPQHFPRLSHKWLPVLAFWAPVLQSLLVRRSSSLGPMAGPALTEALTYAPLAALSVFSFISRINATGSRGPMFNQYTTAALGVATLSAHENAAMRQASVSAMYKLALPRSGLQHLLALWCALISPSKRLLWVIPALLHSAILDVHVPLARNLAVLNTTLQTQADFSILARQESLTGYVSVLERINEPFRVLRCDHSLLGGEWLFSPDGPTGNAKVKEPVYTVFVTLEAVRLVETNDPRNTQGDAVLGNDHSKQALVIGLGIGTSATALIHHGVNTTIVEIDSVVYEYAKQFFSLPSDHNAVIGDAVQYVKDAQHATQEQGRYDYIIHDVFTGGVEPGQLFTTEFLTGFHTLLEKDGVIAINYAGDLRQPAARMIIRTIISVFPSCRIFRDEAAPTSPTIETDFTNVMVFCTKSTEPFTFRRPTEADLLGSEARRHYLLPRFEIDTVQFNQTEDDLGLLDETSLEKLEASQRKSAVGHWRIMRTVLPDAVWELW